MLIRKSKGSFYISIKMISIFLCVCFMSHELSLYAEPATLTQIKQEIKEEAFFVIPHIPQTLGTLQESYNAGAKAPTIIFIQDAHDSLEAQENIASLVNYFVDQYHSKTVFEEGYEGNVPTDEYFDFIKDPLKKQRASYFLMDKLRLGGAEYAHINREQDFKLIGVDDRKLHAKNLEAYKSSAFIRSEIASQIQVIEKEIKKLANQKLPNEFKEWMRIREKFDRSEMDIAQYLKRVRQLFLKNKSEDSFKTSYPHITMILSWDHQGAGHSFESKINYKDIFEELHQLEKDYADAYLNRQNQKKIFAYYNNLQLIKKLGAIEMSSEEFDVIQASLGGLKTETMADFVVSETGKSIVFSNAWEEQIQHAIQFYEIALQRDAAFESHLKQQLMNLKEEKAAVLVFGGFHKDHIREILKKNKISYHIISPNITQASPKHRAYYKQLMGIGYHDFENSLMASKAAKTNPVFSLPFGRAQLSAISQSLDRIDMESDLWLSELEMAMTSLASRSELRSPSYQIDLKQSEYVLSLIKPLYKKPLLPNAPEFSETLLSGGIRAGAANKFGVLDMLLNAISDDPSFHDEVIKIFEEAPRKIATEIELAIEVLQWIRKTEFSATNLPEGLNQRIAMHIKDGGGSSGIVDELRKYTGYLPPQGSSSDQFLDDRSAQREKMQLERKRIVEEHPEWLEQLEETLRVLKPKLIDALTALLRIDESKQQTDMSEAENRASKESRSELRTILSINQLRNERVRKVTQPLTPQNLFLPMTLRDEGEKIGSKNLFEEFKASLIKAPGMNAFFNPHNLDLLDLNLDDEAWQAVFLLENNISLTIYSLLRDENKGARTNIFKMRNNETGEEAIVGYMHSSFRETDPDKMGDQYFAVNFGFDIYLPFRSKKDSRFQFDSSDVLEASLRMIYHINPRISFFETLGKKSQIRDTWVNHPSGFEGDVIQLSSKYQNVKFYLDFGFYPEGFKEASDKIAEQRINGASLTNDQMDDVIDLADFWILPLVRSELRNSKQLFWSETPRLSDAETTQRLDRLMLQYAHIRQQQEQPISTFSEYGAFLPSEAELLQDFVEKQNLDPYRLNRQLKKLIPLTTLVSFLASYFIVGTFFSALVMPVMIATVITAIVFAILYYFSLKAIAQEQGRVGGLKILDVGMGDGFAGRVLKAYTHAHVTAIELDPERFQYSLDVEQYIRNSSDLEFQSLSMLEGDFLTHPIENYDAIYQYFAAPHVNNSEERERKMLEFAEAILEKLDRELKSGAVFVSPLFGGHKKTKSPEMKKLLAKFPNLKFSYYSTQANGTDHPTLVIRRRSELRSSLIENAYEARDLIGYIKEFALKHGGSGEIIPLKGDVNEDYFYRMVRNLKDGHVIAFRLPQISEGFDAILEGLGYVIEDHFDNSPITRVFSKKYLGASWYALQEMLKNAWIHGHKGSLEKEIYIFFDLDEIDKRKVKGVHVFNHATNERDHLAILREAKSEKLFGHGEGETSLRYRYNYHRHRFMTADGENLGSLASAEAQSGLMSVYKWVGGFLKALLVEVFPNFINTATHQAPPAMDVVLSSENRRSELRSSDMAVDEKVSQYMQLERFLNNNRISSGQNRDGTLYVPTPLSILPAIHRELTRFVGPLKDKRYLSFGAGGLVDSLAASSLAGMKVTAIEKDLILEKHAQTILTQAINHGIEGAKNIQLSAGDAFEVSWKDEDVVFFFYTQSGGSVEIRNQYRTTFEKQLEIKIAEMKPGSTIALLFTGTQLMAEQDDYEVLKALENQRLQISDEMTGLYLDLYRIPERSELRFSQDSIDVEYLKEVTGFFLGDESFIHPEGLTYAIRDFFVRDKMASTTRLVKELVGENYSAEDVKHLHLRNFQFGQYFLIFKGTLTLSNGKEVSFTFVAPSPVDVGNNQRINREFELLSKYHALRPDNVVRPYFKGEGSVGEQTDERSIKHLSFYTSQFLPDFIEMNPQYLSMDQLHFFMNSGGRESEAIASLQLNQEDRDTHESVMSEIVKNIVELTVYDEKTGRFTFPTELQLLRGDMMLRPNGKGKDSSFDLKLIAIRAEKENASIVEYFAYLLNPHFGAATNSSKAISPRSVFRGMAQGLVHTYGLEKGNQYFEDWLRTFVEEVDLSSNYGRDLFEMIDQFYEQKLSAQALAAETNQVDIVDNVGDVSAGLNTTSLRKALDGIFGSSNSHEQIRIVNGKEIRILYAEKYIQIEEFVFLDPEDWEKHAEQLEPVKDHIILTHLKKGMLSGRAAFIHHGHSDNAISLMLSKREIFKDQIVLDAGSGDGVLSRLASKLGAKEVISVENGKHAIAAAQQIALLSPDSKIQLYEQDILKVKESLSEKSIGVVIANLNPDDFWKDENYDDWHIRLMNDFKPEWYFYMGLKDDGSGLIQAVVNHILQFEWEQNGLIHTPGIKSYGLKGFVFKRKQRAELRLAENPIEEKIRSSEAAAILLIDGGMLATRHELRVEAFAMAYQTKALTHLRLIIYDAEKLGVEAYEQFSTLGNVRLVRGNVRMALNQYGRSKSLKRVHLIQDSLAEQLANVDSFLWNDAVDIWAALIYALSDEYVLGISKIKGIYRMIGDALKAKLQEYRSHLIVRISA